MSPRTADEMVSFVKRRLTPDKNRLQVDFYGGEPLLSAGLIETVSRAFKEVADAAGIEYRCSLVTNGSLLTRRLVKKLVPLGLRSAKVTLDGPAEIHNRYRPFKSGVGSFDVVLNNIVDTCDLIRVGVGGNYDADSWPFFMPPSGRAGRRGLGPRGPLHGQVRSRIAPFRIFDALESVPRGLFRLS